MTWSIREAAILALCAIAVECNEMQEDLMERLIELLSDSDLSQRLFTFYLTVHYH